MIGLIGINTKNGRIRDRKINHYKLSTKRSLILRFISTCLSLSLVCVSVLGPLLGPISVYAGAAGVKIGMYILMMLLSSRQVVTDQATLNAINNSTVLQRDISTLQDGTTTISDLNSALASDPGLRRVTVQLSNSEADCKILKERMIENGATPEQLSSFESRAATAGENIKESAETYLSRGEMSQAYGGQSLLDMNLQASFGMVASAYEAAKLGNFQQFTEWAHSAGLTQEEIDAATDSGAAFGDPSDFQDYINEYRKSIANGVSVSSSSNDLNTMYPGGRTAHIVTRRYGTYTWSVDNTDAIFLTSPSTSVRNFVVHIKRGSTGTWKKSYSTGSSPSYTSLSSGNTIYSNQSNDAWVSYSGFIEFPNVTALENFISDYDNGTSTAPTIKSPSVVTDNGNMQGSYNPNSSGNKYTIPTQSFYNVGSDTIKNFPTEQEYQSLADQLNDNFDDNVSNDGFVQDWILPYLSPRDVIQPVIPQPDIPSDNIDVPTYNPDFDPADIIPDQPTPDPKPTTTPEEETENESVMATGGLKDVFPFCIPWDIALMLSKFEMEREAPHLLCTINLGPAGSYDIDLNFADWDDIASLLRLLELIAFIIGLALAARKLIGD